MEQTSPGALMTRLGSGILVVVAALGWACRGAPESDPARGTTHFAVDSRLAWQATGVHVEAGEGLAVRATGEYAFRVEGDSCGADGIPGAEPYTGAWPAPELVGLALIGRVGVDGDPFFVGTSADLTAEASGELELRVNDDILDENSGSLQVTITGG